MPPPQSRPAQLAITIAPVVFVLLWSTGFIGARYGLPYIEPLTFLAVRMAFVVVLMAGICMAIYFMGTALLTSGALGETLQERE